MEEKLQKQSINRLDISDNTINRLTENNVKNIGQLCRKRNSELLF